jgi:hypothetical protein
LQNKSPLLTVTAGLRFRIVAPSTKTPTLPFSLPPGVLRRLGLSGSAWNIGRQKEKTTGAREKLWRIFKEEVTRGRSNGGKLEDGEKQKKDVGYVRGELVTANC